MTSIMSESAGGVVVTCGSCGAKLRVRGHADGKIGKCPKCGVRVQLSMPAPAAPEPGPAPVTQRVEVVAPAPAAAAVPEPAPVTPRELVAALRPDPSPQPARASRQETPPQTPSKPKLPGECEPGQWYTPSWVDFPPAEDGEVRPASAFSVATVAMASMLLGAAACYLVEKFTGMEFWVVKRSIAAWLIGMVTAGAMMVATPRRGLALRFLAATTAVAAVFAGKSLASPVIEVGPIEILTMVLAVAGSTCGFVLAEPGHGRKTIVPA